MGKVCWHNVALPAAHWREGWQRKRRHLSTAPRYRRRDQLKLGVDAALDPLIVLTALAGALGPFAQWGLDTPLCPCPLQWAVRSFTLSSFSRETWGRRSFPIGDGLFLGPIRWNSPGFCYLEERIHLIADMDAAGTDKQVVIDHLSDKAKYDYGLIRSALDSHDQAAFAELMERYREAHLLHVVER